MTCWQHGHLTKWLDIKMTWQNDHLTKWSDNEMTCWQNDTAPKKNLTKTILSQREKMPKGKMSFHLSLHTFRGSDTS